MTGLSDKQDVSLYAWLALGKEEGSDAGPSARSWAGPQHPQSLSSGPSLPH